MSKILVAADLSNIEGRGLAFLANEKWKLEAFRAYDRGEGPDLYNITATSIIGGDPYEVSKKNRNAFGKVPDLFGGFEGGVGACQQFAKAYGIQMVDHWDTIQANTDPAHIASAKANYAKWGEEKAEDMEISKEEWIASETVKLAWRARHPATREFWKGTKNAVINAIQHPGEIFKAGPHIKVSVRRKGGHPYLLAKLPSGRYLTYFHPKLEGEGYDMKISYMGDYRRTPASPPIWGKVFSYGGKFVENFTQAFARDVMAYGMQPAEDAGYAIVLTVHDEEVTESEGGTAEELSAIMATVPPWAEGLPLAAAGFTATRYKKD